MKKKDLARARVPHVTPPRVTHVNRQIPPEAHTPMYVWHKYWSRKTWNVVGEHITSYTKEQGIVFDPFAGSGVVAIEAARHKRRAIVSDLNPIASRITELTLRHVSLTDLRAAYDRVEEKVRKRIEALYEVHCVKCGQPLIAACFVREGDAVTEVRYPGCPHCGHRAETGEKPRKKDLEALAELERKRITEWYPKNRLYYASGEGFKEKQQYDSLDQLFTKRNLRAAAILHEAIMEENSPQLKKFLLGAFTSMIHLCTRMCPALAPGEGNHQTAFSSTWSQHSYWSAQVYLEQNVWDKFESAMLGHQGLMKAKEESNELLGKVRLTTDWKKVLSGEADIAVLTEDSIELMRRMPEESVDYIFTDPPYDAAIQYGELSYLWNAWLKEDFRYTERIQTHEVVRNEQQQKPFETFHGLLSSSFQGMHRVLRPDSFLTLTFHNPTFKVRNSTVRAGVFAGFDYQHIHHQPLGQVSAKSMLQPFGSAQGDFYLRFSKRATGETRTMEEVSEERFRKIVIETCTDVIARRAEPTPYTILINQVDPELAKRGLFGALQTGLDVLAVLKESLGTTFKLVPAKLGGASGELWWFSEEKLKTLRLETVPLSERVEETVYRSLSERGRVTFTDVWDAVSREFPNSLTSDSTSIKDALEIYGTKASSGYWMLKPEIRLAVTAHSEMISYLAKIGGERGYDIWIGQREQRDEFSSGVAQTTSLRELVTVDKPTKLEGVKNASPVLQMDLLWLKDGKVMRAFEVESTTTMTSGLQRGSNLPKETPKIMVIPEDREGDLKRKMESPLFNEHFNGDNWQLIYFEGLRQAFAKTKAKTKLEDICGVKKNRSRVEAVMEEGQRQQDLFSFDYESKSESSYAPIVAEDPAES
ncbi:MAG: DNA methyltransferase [Verrucomicrobiota bacterium]